MYCSAEIASVQNSTLPISKTGAMVASRTDRYDDYFLIRIAPTAVSRCSRSVSFKRAFSA
jgi:hypothetical protein